MVILSSHHPHSMDATLEMTCHCKMSCDSRRCACLKLGQACKSNCSCRGCKNPLNSIKNLDCLNPCLLSNIKAYQKLSNRQLSQAQELPCGCEEASLQSLIDGYECSDCGDEYRYSFCWKMIIEENHTWHCETCNQCREYREWHCKHCNKCTYGLSLPCEGCGRKSDIAKMIG